MGPRYTWLAFALSCCTAACKQAPSESRLSEPTGPAEIRAAPPTSFPSGAAHVIAQVRCDNERRCNNLGPDKTYRSSEDCQRRVEAQWHEDLNLLDCPLGVREDNLAACLRVIRTSQCGDVLATLRRWVECAPSRICDGPARVAPPPSNPLLPP
jgi:hypothetical protein